MSFLYFRILKNEYHNLQECSRFSNGHYIDHIDKYFFICLVSTLLHAVQIILRDENFRILTNLNLFETFKEIYYEVCVHDIASFDNENRQWTRIDRTTM